MSDGALAKIVLDNIPTMGHIFITLFREGGVVRMSPENVERVGACALARKMLAEVSGGSR
jgi:hypothetical protein